MKVVLIVIIVICFLLLLPLRLKLHFYYNIKSNRGTILVSLWGVKILFYRITVKKFKIKIKNKKETKTIDIDINAPNIDFVNELQSQLVKKMYVPNLELIFRYGKKEDAFTVAMVSGSLGVICSVISGVITSKKPECQICCITYANFEKDKIIINFKCKVFITLFEIASSLIKAKIIISKKRRLKNGK